MKSKHWKLCTTPKLKKSNPTCIKELQNKHCQANKIAADKSKKLNKLKGDIIPEKKSISTK